MKKNWKKRWVYLWISVSIFLFMAGSPESAYAQKYSIVFSNTTWKKQLKQAKREKKLIFLDCHTKWCGFIGCRAGNNDCGKEKTNVRDYTRDVAGNR